MRLNTLSLPSLLLLSFLPLLVDAYTLKSATHTAIAQRQWKPNRPKRDLLDICVDLSVVAELVPLLGSDVELCLCLKDLDIFLDAHANVESDALGIRSKLAALLLPLFDKHAPHCNPLPAHAHRACKSSNPCHFDCDSGYILVGHQCVCNGCSTPSPVPRALKARAASSDTAKVSAADALRVDNGVGPASKDVVNNLADGVPSGASSSDSSSPAVPCHLSEPSSPVFTPAPLSSQPSPSSSVQLSTLSSLPTPHDDLRALTRNILVQFGPRVQDLLKDFGVSCGCYDGLAGHDSNDVRVSLKSIVDLSTSFGGLLANMKSNLSLVDQLLLDTTQLIANIKHCLGLNLDYDLTDSLSELLAATQALLQALDSLKDGLMTCGCAEDLLVSLPHDLHVISDSDGASSQNSVIHPARAYPIRRELLYQAHRDTPTSTFSVETDTKHPANDKPGF